jgi:hypothetical protein
MSLVVSLPPRYDEAKAACALDDKIHAVDLRLMWVATREEEESAEAQRVLLQELEGKADATRAKAQSLQADIEGMRAKLEAVKYVLVRTRGCVVQLSEPGSSGLFFVE